MGWLYHFKELAGEAIRGGIALILWLLWLLLIVLHSLAGV